MVPSLDRDVRLRGTLPLLSKEFLLFGVRMSEKVVILTFGPFLELKDLANDL